MASKRSTSSSSSSSSAQPVLGEQTILGMNFDSDNESDSDFDVPELLTASDSESDSGSDSGSDFELSLPPSTTCSACATGTKKCTACSQRATNRLSAQTILAMDFDTEEMVTSDSDYVASDGVETDPYLSDAPSSGDDGQGDNLIRRVPASEFNKHFDKCTNATLLNNAKHKLARKRKIMERIAAKRGRTRKHKVDKSSKVSPEDRAENFAEEGMTVEAGVLWCSFCSTQVRRQCCAIKQHCKTQMHARNKKKADRDSARASAIKTVLDFATLSGTLQEETLLHRAQVCRAFVQENISFELLRNPQGLTRSLLQYHRGTLPRNETMAFIPMLLEDEIKRVTQELLDAKDISFSLRLPAVPETALAGLRAELGEYRTIALAHDPDSDLWAFWRHYQLRLPVWYKLACNVALIMTSSASVERLFSLYEGRFGDQQQGALEDYRESSIMLRYNELQRAKYN